LIRNKLGGSGGRETLTPKKRAPWDINSKFSVSKASEILKTEVSKEKMAIFGNSMGKFGQILINVMILDLFDYKYNSFIDFAKVEKKFWKFFKNFG